MSRVFQVGDHVKNRYPADKAFTGKVVGVSGRWIHVKHDRNSPTTLETSRFDYQADELEHVNPLLRVVRHID